MPLFFGKHPYQFFHQLPEKAFIAALEEAMEEEDRLAEVGNLEKAVGKGLVRIIPGFCG